MKLLGIIFDQTIHVLTEAVGFSPILQRDACKLVRTVSMVTLQTQRKGPTWAALRGVACTRTRHKAGYKFVMT